MKSLSPAQRAANIAKYMAHKAREAAAVKKSATTKATDEQKVDKVHVISNRSSSQLLYCDTNETKSAAARVKDNTIATWRIPKRKRSEDDVAKGGLLKRREIATRIRASCLSAKPGKAPMTIQ